MNDHITARQMQHYQERTLRSGERLQVSDHLADCEACRRKVHEGKTVPSAAQVALTDLLEGLEETPQHLSYEELAAYAEGFAGDVDREIVEGHAASCDMCAAELNDLLSFRDLLASSPNEGDVQVAAQTLQDTAGAVVVEPGGRVRLPLSATVSRAVTRQVRELLTMGMAAPSRSLRAVMDTLSAAMMPAPLPARSGDELPIPLSPAGTAVRSPDVTLQWQAVPGALEYQVVLARQVGKTSRKVIWEGNVGGSTQIELPGAVPLKRGQLYFWQVIAKMKGQFRPSTLAWFSVLTEKALQRVETAEAAYDDSALIRAGLYEEHGLYEEALAQLERLARLNPGHPLSDAMLNRLRHRTRF